MNRFGIRRFKVRHKARYLNGPDAPPWSGVHKTSRKRANRRSRHRSKVDLRP